MLWRLTSRLHRCHGRNAPQRHAHITAPKEGPRASEAMGVAPFFEALRMPGSSCLSHMQCLRPLSKEHRPNPHEPVRNGQGRISANHGFVHTAPVLSCHCLSFAKHALTRASALGLSSWPAGKAANSSWQSKGPHLISNSNPSFGPRCRIAPRTRMLRGK